MTVEQLNPKLNNKIHHASRLTHFQLFQVIPARYIITKTIKIPEIENSSRYTELNITLKLPAAHCRRYSFQHALLSIGNWNWKPASEFEPIVEPTQANAYLSTL
jgi:hypothetical protein